MKYTCDYDTYIDCIEQLHAVFTPHSGQVEIGKAFFTKEMQYVFAKCGRNFGKTEIICYLVWRWAQCNPNSESYYFAPLAKQAKELVWAQRRLQNFGPRAWLCNVKEDGLEGINNSEMRLRFKNGSFIKMDGADNIDSYRGIKPKGLIVYDEYKDFKPEFHEAMDPNLAERDDPNTGQKIKGTLFVVGTPPEVEDHHFYHLEEEFKLNKEKGFFSFPTSTNPHISKDWLDKKKEELYRKGEGDAWEREYMVKKVFGGKNAIFPMLSREKHVRPHEEIMLELKKDMHKLQWINASDPGTATCFATVFTALNPFTRKLYVLDNIYEQDQKKTVTSLIGKRILNTEFSLYRRGDWNRIYDDAATWFQNEFTDQFDEAMMPAHKAQRDKQDGLSLIKDMLLNDCIVFSDKINKKDQKGNVVGLLAEMFNYVKDKNNKIPKENDHAIDALRYILGFLNYDMNHMKEPGNIELERKEIKPFYKMEEDFEQDMNEWEYQDSNLIEEGTY